MFINTDIDRPTHSFILMYTCSLCLQCFNTAGWAAGRASGL